MRTLAKVGSEAMDKRSCFLKWFSKHHRFCGHVYTILSLICVYTLFFDVLHYSTLKFFLFVLWDAIFVLPGQSAMEHLLCAAAERLESDNT